MNVRKHSEAEFTEYMLPHNRRQVFFDCIKMRYGVFVLSGLLLFAFLLPFFAVKIYSEIVYANVFTIATDAALLETSAKNIKFYASIAYIPCMAIFSLALAGVVRVIRQLVWAEGLFFWKDFGAGIKQNGASYVLTAVIFSSIFALNRFILTIDTTGSFVAYIPTGLIVMLVIPITLFTLSLTAVYTNKYSVTVKNAALLYSKNIPASLIFSLMLVSLLLLDLITVGILKYVIMAILAVFLLPLFIEARFLFDCYVFDKYINVYSYPDYVDKGMFRMDG